MKTLMHHYRPALFLKQHRKVNHVFYSMDIGTNIDVTISMVQCRGHVHSKCLNPIDRQRCIFRVVVNYAAQV